MIEVDIGSKKIEKKTSFIQFMYNHLTNVVKSPIIINAPNRH